MQHSFDIERIESLTKPDSFVTDVGIKTGALGLYNDDIGRLCEHKMEHTLNVIIGPCAMKNLIKTGGRLAVRKRHNIQQTTFNLERTAPRLGSGRHFVCSRRCQEIRYGHPFDPEEMGHLWYEQRPR